MLRETITVIKEDSRGQRINIGTLIDSIEQEVFGVLLLLASLVIMLPVSLIPGVSSLCAVIVLFAATHIFLDREQLWLPQRIRKISLCRQKLVHSLEKLHECLKGLDRFSKPRLKFMTKGLAQKLAAGAGIILAAAAIVLGFIPLMDIPLMAPIVFFGLGVCKGDGLMTAIGWVILGLCLGIIAYFI